MKKPKVNEVWYDNNKNRRFFIYDMIKDTDYAVYKPFDVLYDNNQTRYLETKYILENCTYIGKSKIKFEELFTTKEGKW